MSIVSTGSGEAGRGSIEIEVSSPKEIAERALSRQSSALSSSLAKASLSRSVSCPSHDLTADSPFADFRSTPIGEIKEDQSQWYNGHLLGGPQYTGPKDDDSELDTLSTSAQSKSLKVPAPKIRRRNVSEKSELAASLDDNDDEFIPPHIMSLPKGYGNNADLRSHPGSLFEGVGRKLRGMDAERFRRDVMRRTGFLEATAEHSVC